MSAEFGSLIEENQKLRDLLHDIAWGMPGLVPRSLRVIVRGELEKLPQSAEAREMACRGIETRG